MASFQSPENLKNCWENIKRGMRKDVAEVNREIIKTGGGKPKILPDHINTKVETILGPTLDGFPNSFDTDFTGEIILTQILILKINGKTVAGNPSNAFHCLAVRTIKERSEAMYIMQALYTTNIFVDCIQYLGNEIS